MAVSLGISISQNSQNIASNTSNVSVSVYCSWTYGSHNNQTYNGVPDAGGWLNIDGTYYYFNSTFNNNRTNTGSQTLYTKTLDISHDVEGVKTLYCSSQFATGVSSGTISASASRKLTDIPRFAVINSAPNFNDEDNPTITYSNPAGTNVTSLRACISLDGSNADIAYRDISKTGTSYTFNLTEAERDVLRAATTGSNSRTVKFYVRSEIGNGHNGSNLARTFTIKNPNPVINPTITDTNDITYGLTGDRNKLIKYYSNAAVTIGASAVKKASLKSQRVTCGNKSLTSNGTMSAIETNDFVFTATDSRGNTTSKTVKPSFVNYIRLTCSLGNNMPSADGTMTVKANGNCFNGSFGAKNNSLSVYYRYKVYGGSYGNWAAMSVSKSGNTYSATVNLTGLDYQTAYVVQTYATDALSTIYSVEKTIKATPVFDWGESDFKFNVPVDIDGHLSASGFELSEQEITITGDMNTYYPVHISTNITSTAMPQYLFLRKTLGSTSPEWSGNHSSGTSSIRMGWMCRNGGWDGNGNFCNTLYKTESYAKLISHIDMPSSGASGIVLYLRGGGATYNIASNFPITINTYYTSTNISVHSSYTHNVEPKTSIENAGVMWSAIPHNLDAYYPVNSIYISYSHTSPAELFGGTWHRMQSRFLWGTTTDGNIGATAGEMTHTLTIDEMPSHRHGTEYSTDNGSTWLPMNPFGRPGTYESDTYMSVGSAVAAYAGYQVRIKSEGGGVEHNNMPPYVNVAIWRRTA